MIDGLRYPDKQAFLDNMADMVVEHGGFFGIRDEGGLDAAIARGEQILAYTEETVTIFEIAAAIVYAITKMHHPFIDGNKRPGLLYLYGFLAINGCDFDASERAATTFFNGIAAGDHTEQDLAVWIAANSWEN